MTTSVKLRKHAFLVMLAGGMLAGLTARGFGGGTQLRVTSQPDKAQVLLDGQVQDVAPVSLQRIEPGQHLLEVRKEGYQSVRKTVSLFEGEKRIEDIKLELVKGLVLIHTTPAGAEVDIDKAYRGKTPLLLTDLTLGDHTVVLRTEGFQPRTLALQIPSRVPVKLNTDLASDSAKLNITSVPPGATVTLNGASRGTTPCTVDRIPSGTIDLDINLKGFATYHDRVVLKAGDVLDVQAPLKAVPAALSVHSIPEQARIYLNDQYKGDTPLVLTNLPPAKYRVRAEKRGFETDARDVALEPDDQKTEEFRLQRNSGGLVIVSEPPGAQVYIDDENAGTTLPSAINPLVSEPLRVSYIGRGDHWLKLVKPGYAHTPSKITIDSDNLITRTEHMIRLFIPDTVVRTGPAAEDSYTGVLIRKHPNGDVELEMRPGIFKRFEAATIRAITPITDKK